MLMTPICKPGSATSRVWSRAVWGCLSCWLRWASFAVRAIPGADGAGVTLLRVDRPDNMVAALAASAPFCRRDRPNPVRDPQRGPCITAALERRTVRSGSLGGEKMAAVRSARGQVGGDSALLLPLLLPDQVVGARQVYAHAKDWFLRARRRTGNCSPNLQWLSLCTIAHPRRRACSHCSSCRRQLSMRPVIDPDDQVRPHPGRTGRCRGRCTPNSGDELSEHRKNWPDEAQHIATGWPCLPARAKRNNVDLESQPCIRHRERAGPQARRWISILYAGSPFGDLAADFVWLTARP